MFKAHVTVTETDDSRFVAEDGALWVVGTRNNYYILPSLQGDFVIIKNCWPAEKERRAADLETAFEIVRTLDWFYGVDWKNV